MSPRYDGPVSFLSSITDTGRPRPVLRAFAAPRHEEGRLDSPGTKSQRDLYPFTVKYTQGKR